MPLCLSVGKKKLDSLVKNNYASSDQLQCSISSFAAMCDVCANNRNIIMYHCCFTGKKKLALCKKKKKLKKKIMVTKTPYVFPAKVFFFSIANICTVSLKILQSCVIASKQKSKQYGIVCVYLH